MSIVTNTDKAPPGRENQVKALKGQSSVENPYAVAWASYEGASGKGSGKGPSYMAAKCDDCGNMVPVKDGVMVSHLAMPVTDTLDPMSADPDDDEDEEAPKQDARGYGPGKMCPGSGKAHADTIEHRGGKWVLLSKTTGKVLGSHATKEEAEAQERAVQASKHGDAAPTRRTVRRYDRFQLAPPQRTAEGYLRVDGRIARIGIQEYRDGQGRVKRELRLPEQVFDAASMESFHLVPVTNQHPPVLLDASNAKSYAVGAVGDLRRDGDYVAASLLIHDAKTIADVESGRQQLSNGYTCEVVDEPGEWRGQKYDSVQKDIRGNHLAIVDVARAGPGASLRLDAGDAEAAEVGEFGAPVSRVVASAKERTTRMITIKVDGMSFECNDANAQTAIDRAIAAAEKRGEEKAVTEKAHADAAEKVAAEAQKNLAAFQARHDSLEARLKTALKFDASEGSPEIMLGDLEDAAKRAAWAAPAMARQASERAILLTEARGILGANEKLDELSNMEIKRRVVSKLNKDVKLEGKGDDYVAVRYEVDVENAKKASRHNTAEQVRAGVAPPVVNGEQRGDAAPRPSDPNEARRQMVERTLRINRGR
jgi:hypothetical protein